MKKAAHSRIGVIALKKAEDKTGIDERSDDELLGAQFETLRALQKMTQHSANDCALQPEERQLRPSREALRDTTATMGLPFSPQSHYLYVAMLIGVASTLSVFSDPYGIAFVFRQSLKQIKNEQR